MKSRKIIKKEKTPHVTSPVEENKKAVVGSVKVGMKGQIVIPKNVREHMNIDAGDSLFVIAHGETITLVKTEKFMEFARKILEEFS